MKCRVLLVCVVACCAETRPLPHAPPAVERQTVVEPVDIATLARFVDQLPAATDEVPQRVATILDLVADYTTPGTKARIERAAHELGTGHDGKLVRTALGMALDSFATNMSMPPDSRSRSAYMQARRARRQIMPDVPLERQIAPIAQSLRAITALLAIEHHQPSPYLLGDPRIDVGADPDAFAAHRREASEAIHELAATREWSATGRVAADALDALADAIATAPLELDIASWRSIVREMRFQANELALGPANIDRAAHIKAGLVACASALAALDANGHLSQLAIDAAERLDGRGLLGQERGSVQEAFRLASDALLAADRSAAR